METQKELFKQARITVVAVGGGGGNMLSHIMANDIHKDVKTVAVNTDKQALENCPADVLLGIGKNGLGAGAKPTVAKKAAEDLADEIKEAIEGSDMVFIAAGLGGGTGTGASPVIAEIAEKLGALVISVVTLPFSFEGKRRKKIATEGLAELEIFSNSVIVIENNNLMKIIDPKMGIKESFKKVDDILSQAINGVTGVILASGENDINLDFADLKTVMDNRGRAIMGVGESQTGDAEQALDSAMDSPLIDNADFSQAKGVLVHFHLHPEYPFFQLGMAMEEIQERVHEDCEIIFGTTTTDAVDPNSIHTTLVATGIFNQEEASKESRNILSEEQIMVNVQRMAPSIEKINTEQGHPNLDIPSYTRRRGI